MCITPNKIKNFRENSAIFDMNKPSGKNLRGDSTKYTRFLSASPSTTNP